MSARLGKRTLTWGNCGLDITSIPQVPHFVNRGITKMGTKGFVFSPGMAEYLSRYPPHIQGLYMQALWKHIFDRKYSEKKPEWCREWLELAEAEQDSMEIRNKRRRMLKDAEYRQILAYLNEKTGRGFRMTDNFRDRVDARIREGAHIEDFMSVVDNTAAAWAGNPKMRMYLRPETLFGAKFESYRVMQGGSFAESSFETDVFFEAALKKSYGDMTEEEH